MHPTNAAELWHSNDEAAWKAALRRYWDGGFINPANLALERDMDALDAEVLRDSSATAWYDFLHDRYFRWKYTSPNRYTTTTGELQTYFDTGTLAELQAIKDGLFRFDRLDIKTGLRIATQIRGLGTAGASGLLAILFPGDFGTVDQFAVRALRAIPSLPQQVDLNKMNPENLSISDGVKLIQIMREKARDLNSTFSTQFWTPRRIDMVLWVADR